MGLIKSQSRTLFYKEVLSKERRKTKKMPRLMQLRRRIQNVLQNCLITGVKKSNYLGEPRLPQYQNQNSYFLYMIESKPKTGILDLSHSISSIHEVGYVSRVLSK